MASKELTLYRARLESVTWTKCGGNTGDAGTDESCALMAEIPGTDGAWAIRDSKNPAAGELRFDREEMRALMIRAMATL